jgi:hypothetical protein
VTQNDFNVAFDDLAGDPLTPQQIAARIAQRDHRRTILLASLSLFFWLLGTTGMMLMVVGLNQLVIYIRIAPYLDSPATHQRGQPLSEADVQRFWGTDLIHHSMPWIGGSVVALMLAALFTVLLIFSSRRATLHRINLSLKLISEQLKQMRESATPQK